MKTILLQNFSVVSNGLKDERKVVQNKLNTIEQRIEKARDMFIEDKLDEEDFRSIKGKSKVEIENLKSKLSSMKSSEENNNVEQKID